MKNDIYIRFQNNYNISDLKKNMEILLNESGLWNILKEKNIKTILLKPNLLGKYNIASAVVTHPDLVYVIATILKEHGYEIGIGDSSASFFKMRFLFYDNGYGKIFDENLAKMENFEMKPFEKLDLNNKKVSHIFIANAVKTYDFVISLPKLKTHNISIITCCMKNYYGIIPGVRKSHYHRVFHRFKDFNRFLVDIYEKIHADYYIIDGILGMEGDGPSGGYPRKFNLISAGENGLQMDAYFLFLMGVDAMKLDYFQYAKSKGCFHGSSFESVHTPFEKGYRFDNFKLPIAMKLSGITNILPGFLFDFLKIQPEIDADKCILCGKCVEKCPEDAMKLKNEKIVIDYSNCIACGCCKEVCPQEAIHMEQNKLMKFFSHFSFRKR
ncbi:DUF362 domain-containing protein [bacterium]|nr:DUF362 domain-containing protein [bacterium]